MRALSRLKLFCIATGSAAVLLIVALRPSLSPQLVVPVLFFSLLIFLSEAMAVKLPRGGTVSVSFVVTFSAVLIFGPALGAVLAAVATISKEEFERRSGELRWIGFFLNRSQLALSAGIGGLVYKYFQEIVIGIGPQALIDIVPIFAGGSIYFLINMTLVTVSLALQQQMSFFNMWLVNIRWAIPNYLALVPLAYLIVVVFETASYVGVLFFFLPLLLAKYAFQRYVDIRQMFFSTVRALTRTLEAKDSYTSGHAARVSQTAAHLARHMGMSEDRVELMELAGMLHDIGKIGVDDRILNKAGRYTEEEYAIMKTHTEIGDSILADVEALKEARNWVRHHHERIDGNGYPDGLAGDEIPLGARIIAVADAFDAMITRNFERTRSLTEILTELQDCSGSQFDPCVVKAMGEILNDEEIRGEIEERLAADLNEEAIQQANRFGGGKAAKNGNLSGE